VTGDKIASCVESFPALDLQASLHPITRGVVRIQLTITPEFVWKVGVLPPAIEGRATLAVSFAVGVCVTIA
jgi:hypothetical protein